MYSFSDCERQPLLNPNPPARTMTTSSLAPDQTNLEDIPQHPQNKCLTPIDRCDSRRLLHTGETPTTRSQSAASSRKPRARPQSQEPHSPGLAVVPSSEQLISFRGTARRLDLSVRAVYRLVARGHLPRPVKVGGARKFFESDIARYLEALKAHRN